MTDMESRIETYFDRVEQNIPTHRSDIGTLAERKNKYKLDYSRSYHGISKYANGTQCVDVNTKCDIITTLLEDGCITFEEFRMRMDKLTVETGSLKYFVNPAYQNGIESRRRAVGRKILVRERLQKKHDEKYSK